MEVMGCVPAVGLISSQQKFQVVVVRCRYATARFRHEEFHPGVVVYEYRGWAQN